MFESAPAWVGALTVDGIGFPAPRGGAGIISKTPHRLALLCSRRAAHGRVGRKYEGAKDQAEW